ncbi:unnamed protein product [Linum trigynum]
MVAVVVVVGSNCDIVVVIAVMTTTTINNSSSMRGIFANNMISASSIAVTIVANLIPAKARTTVTPAKSAVFMAATTASWVTLVIAAFANEADTSMIARFRGDCDLKRRQDHDKECCGDQYCCAWLHS